MLSNAREQQQSNWNHPRHGGRGDRQVGSGPSALSKNRRWSLDACVRPGREERRKKKPPDWCGLASINATEGARLTARFRTVNISRRMQLIAWLLACGAPARRCHPTVLVWDGRNGWAIGWIRLNLNSIFRRNQKRQARGAAAKKTRAAIVLGGVQLSCPPP